jgi:hypothetical protein
MELKQGQRLGLMEGLTILETRKRLLVRGSAGTGKTSMVDALIDEILLKFNVKGPIVCSAPTHKALAILSGKITNSKVIFSTIHSVLKYKKNTNRSTGEETFAPSFSPKYPPMQGYGLLLIDEASMINVEMLSYIEMYAGRCIVIFVGDDKQINPVGEDDSPVFLGKPTLYDKLEYINDETALPYFYEKLNKWITFTPYPEVELTEIIRQGEGNPIITLSRDINLIGTGIKDLNEQGQGYLYTDNFHKVVEELAAVNGTDEWKYLAWTNAEVDRVNLEVRKRIYGPEPAKIELGESIIFDAPYGDYTTNQELKVKTLDIDFIEFNQVIEDTGKNVVTKKVILKCYILNGMKTDDWGDGILRWKGTFIIHEKSENTLKHFIYSLSTNCNKRLLEYTTKNEFISKFAKFKYNHAVSVHKSQGSTYKNTIINVSNIGFNSNEQEKERLFYTGITRASDLLILYNCLKWQTIKK